ncbi:MAG TPA: hypothetical protein PLR06_04285 [Cyclobacteriaceae bacterium]|nr:hypothetical protein [Cyclobacteriaceae bacterium]
MIEIFKTNVTERHLADLLILQIQLAVTNCEVNFDLDDCDRILRVKSTNTTIAVDSIIKLMENWGFYAEVLSDEIQSKQPEPELRH